MTFEDSVSPNTASPSPKTASPSPKIAIAGAGLVGRLLAWRMLRSGCAVDVFEKGRFDTPRSAAHTAAAMISPMSEVVVSERAIYDMGLKSLVLWPQWLDELAVQFGESVDYAAPGSLVVAHAQDTAELTQFYNDLNYHLGLDNQARWLTKNELKIAEPDLAGPFESALYLPGEAYLDNRQLLNILDKNIRRLGGRCFEESPIEFTPMAKLGENILHAYDWIVDCRGFGAHTNQPQLRGVRGEVLWVKTTEVTLNHAVRLMHPRYKLYIVPKPNHHFIVGATEIESTDPSPMSVQSCLELCSALYTLNPAFAEARIIELDTNLRPAYWNNLPCIETEQVLDQNILRINGLYRHGYLLAPYLVEEAIKILL